MRPEIFAELLEDRLERCRMTEQVKGAEYSRGGDRFHKFKRAAAMDGTTPVRSLWGMWKKHLVSIIDMVDDLDRGIVPSNAMIAEKCGDNIVYTLLFEGLVAEMRGDYDGGVDGQRIDVCLREAHGVEMVGCIPPPPGSLGSLCRTRRGAVDGVPGVNA